MKSLLDELDRRIIEILTKDARTPYTDIAKQLGVSEATIRKRVNKLIKGGVIKRFTVEIGESGMKAIVLVKVKQGYNIPDVAKTISKIRDVVKACEVTGEYDVVVEIASPDTISLNQSIEEIRGIEGVGGTLSMIILAIW
ncbi:MAG: AsnC family transcriptional regulator [Thermoproteota archaeon]|nr:Lrp/AsnC family transcriptional regulator [Candidatus Korarchaeota archaeon]RLG44129.1 MAG: AsnC family transcriptional regulator [Candidatus Korarchaeota archaeon]